MREIQLTQGKNALVNDEDFEELSKFHWWFDGSYAVREKMKNGVKVKIYMHRQLMDYPVLVDHKNQNKLDNRKENLRACNKSQQMFNCGLRKNNSSGFKGVNWDKSRNKWVARIQVNRKYIHLGRYKNIEDAIKSYNQGALEYAKDFACLNIL